MQTHTEDNGATLRGRSTREWSVGMESNVKGRKCLVLAFCKTRHHSSVLVRWLEEAPQGWQMAGNVRQGLTQWVGRYEVEPSVW